MYNKKIELRFFINSEIEEMEKYINTKILYILMSH